MTGHPLVIDLFCKQGGCGVGYARAGLCGSSFGLQVRRHRLFECGGWSPGEPPACRHREQGPIVGVYGRPHGNAGAWPGMLPGNHDTWSRAMGIDWMDVDGLSQAIPPAYTQWLGERFRAGR